jgi:hypothetical protein
LPTAGKAPKFVPPNQEVKHARTLLVWRCHFRNRSAGPILRDLPLRKLQAPVFCPHDHLHRRSRRPMAMDGQIPQSLQLLPRRGAKLLRHLRHTSIIPLTENVRRHAPLRRSHGTSGKLSPNPPRRHRRKTPLAKTGRRPADICGAGLYQGQGVARQTEVPSQVTSAKVTLRLLRKAKRKNDIASCLQ